MTVAAQQVLKRVRRELRLILRILRADRLQRERRLGERLRLRREWEGRATTSCRQSRSTVSFPLPLAYTA